MSQSQLSSFDAPIQDEDTQTYKGVEKPWQDVEILHRLYWHEEMTQPEIAEELGCGTTSVGKYMRRNDIPRRTMQESYIKNDPNTHMPLYPHERGYVGWAGHGNRVLVHRLLAVAEFGFETMKGMDVHHGSPDDGPNDLPPCELTWANWPGNLELVRNENHQRKHRKYKGLFRLRVAELYENGELSTRKLAEHLPCSSGSVLKMHREFYGEETGHDISALTNND